MDSEKNHRLRTAFIQFLKFNAVGFSNVAITYGIYSLVAYLTDSHRLGLVANYSVGIVYTYLMNRRFTFKTTGTDGWVGEFLRIVLLYAVVFGVNWFLLNYLVETIGWNKYAAQVAALAFVTMISFLGQKYLVFRKKVEN